MGDEDGEYADPRTRPAPVTVNEQTGDVTVDMGTLSNLFPIAPEPSQPLTTTTEPKVLITTSPGKPPAPFTKTFLDDLQALLGGKKRADVVPRRSPKFEMGRVARWARGRGYGCIMVVGEDHAKPCEWAEYFRTIPRKTELCRLSHSFLDGFPSTLWSYRSLPTHRYNSL